MGVTVFESDDELWYIISFHSDSAVRVLYQIKLKHN